MKDTDRYTYCNDKTSLSDAGLRKDFSNEELICRLADYENTGMSPSEILLLKNKYILALSRIKREIISYTDEIVKTSRSMAKLEGRYDNIRECKRTLCDLLENLKDNDDFFEELTDDEEE